MTITMQRPNAFSPRTSDARLCDLVRVTNADTITHNWKATSGLFASPDLSSGQHYDYRFTVRGSFDFICDIHEGMGGTITVS